MFCAVIFVSLSLATVPSFVVIDLLTFTYTSRSCSRLTDSIFFFFSQYHGSSGRLLIRFFIFDVFLKSFCSGANIWQVKWGHVFTSSVREDFLTLTSLGLPPSQEQTSRQFSDHLSRCLLILSHLLRVSHVSFFCSLFPRPTISSQ